MNVPFDSKIQMVIVDDDTHSDARKWLYHNMKIESDLSPTAAHLFQHLSSTWVDLLLVNVQRRPGFEISAREIVSGIQETPQGRNLPVFILAEDAGMEEAEKPFLYDIEGYLAKPLRERSLKHKLGRVLPELHSRRESHFIHNFMAEYADPDVAESAKRKMAKHLRETSFYTDFVESPTRYPAQERIKVARLFHAVFNDMDRVLLDRVNPEDGETAILILGIIENISTGRSLGIKLTDLIYHPNSRLASKAVKILAKTTDDFIFLKRFLTNPDPRFVANLVEALWDRRDEAAVNVFKMFLDHKVHRIRSNAVVGLYLQGFQDIAVQEIMVMLASGEPSVVQSALWAADFLEIVDILPDVRSLLAHADPEVQQRAAKTVGKLESLIASRQGLGF